MQPMKPRRIRRRQEIGDRVNLKVEGELYATIQLVRALRTLREPAETTPSTGEVIRAGVNRELDSEIALTPPEVVAYMRTMVDKDLMTPPVQRVKGCEGE